MTTELMLTREQIEKFRRVAKTEFAGIRADQVCDQALAAIDLQAEVTALREALKADWHYSDHTGQCALYKNAFEEDDSRCDCGYDEAALLVKAALASSRTEPK